VAVASAGPYASLDLAPDRLPCQHLTTQFFTGQMPFLPPNQQRQSTEGKVLKAKKYTLPHTSIQLSIMEVKSVEILHKNEKSV